MGSWQEVVATDQVEAVRHVAPRAFIHLADLTSGDPRTACGAWGPDVSWTTVIAVVTCPACSRLLQSLAAEQKRLEPAALAADHAPDPS